MGGTGEIDIATMATLTGGRRSNTAAIDAATIGTTKFIATTARNRLYGGWNASRNRDVASVSVARIPRPMTRSRMLAASACLTNHAKSIILQTLYNLFS